MNQTSNDTDGNPKDENQAAVDSGEAAAPAPSEPAVPAELPPPSPEPPPPAAAPATESAPPVAAGAAPDAPAGDVPGAAVSAQPPPTAAPRRPGALRRFFLMEEPLSVARSTGFVRGQAGFREFEFARSVVDGAEAISEFPERSDAATLLFRDGLSLAARAFVARSAGSSEGLGDDPSVWRALVAGPAAGALLAGVGEPEKARIERMLGPGWASEVVGLSKAERGSVNDALARVARQVISSLERDAGRVTKVKVMRAVRWIALLLIVVAVLAALLFGLRSLSKPGNLARGKPVSLSSYHRRDAFPPEKLVDGVTSEIGCHTRPEERPWAQIDLGAEQAIRRVVVHNRQDRFKQRAVPLVIETSTDGKAFTEFARREDAFTVWDATGATTKARFVRVQVQKKSELHLNEVEVF